MSSSSFCNPPQNCWVALATWLTGLFSTLIPRSWSISPRAFKGLVELEPQASRSSGSGQLWLGSTSAVTCVQDRMMAASYSSTYGRQYMTRPPRIEVINLDRSVFQFLKRKNFVREIAFLGKHGIGLIRNGGRCWTTTISLKDCLSCLSPRNGRKSFKLKE